MGLLNALGFGGGKIDLQLDKTEFNPGETDWWNNNNKIKEIKESKCCLSKINWSKKRVLL